MAKLHSVDQWAALLPYTAKAVSVTKGGDVLEVQHINWLLQVLAVHYWDASSIEWVWRGSSSSLDGLIDRLSLVQFIGCRLHSRAAGESLVCRPDQSGGSERFPELNVSLQSGTRLQRTGLMKSSDSLRCGVFNLL